MVKNHFESVSPLKQGIFLLEGKLQTDIDSWEEKKELLLCSDDVLLETLDKMVKAINEIYTIDPQLLFRMFPLIYDLLYPFDPSVDISGYISPLGGVIQVF